MGSLTRRGRAIDRGLIRRVGRPTVWERADLCPNLSDDGTHNPFCTACVSMSERQYLYTPHTRPIKALWVSDFREEDYDAAGSWETGRCRAIFPSHLDIADQDRLVPQDDPIVDRALLTRGASAGTPDRLRTPHVVEVVTVRDADRLYTEGTDFSLIVDANGHYSISWLGTGGQEPAAGANYSVRLLAMPVWVVDGPPKIRAWGPGKKNHLLKTANLLRFDMAVVR